VIERVVFDTSTLVSAVIRPDSIPWQALRRAFLSGEVCASAKTLAEMEEVLERSKFDRYLDRPTRRAAAEQIRRDCRMFVMDPVDASPPCRDPRDNKFLALAPYRRRRCHHQPAIMTCSPCIPGGAFRF